MTEHEKPERKIPVSCDSDDLVHGRAWVTDGALRDAGYVPIMEKWKCDDWTKAQRNDLVVSLVALGMGAGLGLFFLVAGLGAGIAAFTQVVTP